LATVVTVHGTYAHILGPPDAPAPAELQWWQPGSPTEQHIRQLVDAQDGQLQFVPFTWSGDNSERARREAGARLFEELQKLEARNEDYCLVGHSHGGSVIAAALVESAARGRKLEHLKKWITVGTPFVNLRKERFLFTRLTLPRKVVFVASLMLLMMFLFYLGGAIYDGTLGGRLENQLLRFGFSAAMMSLPFICFYVFLKILDARRYFFYRPVVRENAKQWYGDKWVSLNHEDDEAVQGFRLLPQVKLNFFDREFAVPMLTLISIFVLPLAYLFVVTSPTIMVGIADILKTRVYDVQAYAQTERAADPEWSQLRTLRRKLRDARQLAEKSGLEPTVAESAREATRSIRKQIRATRKRMREKYPDLPEMIRAQRFKRRFLERDGQPCDGGTLCGGGRDFRINSALLFHLVTDELSSAFVDADTRWGPLGGLLRLLLPVLLVPVAFALLALGVLMVIRFVAVYFSAFLSRRLNGLTHHQITRTALGNDTEGEIAFGADMRPAWVPVIYPFLPADVGERITAYSNEISFQSLAKFRNAISTLAFAENDESRSGVLTTYLTWRELVHTAYFEVPEFRGLLAYAIGQADGFTIQAAFRSDPDFERAAGWHDSMRPEPVA
jgi:hypothetical protein